jgi:hypothetical protein
MKRNEKDYQSKKKLNRIFITIFLIVMAVTSNFYPLYIENKIEKDNKLENSEHIVLTPYDRELFVNYFIEERYNLIDRISSIESRGDQKRFERDAVMMNFWDKSNDSELLALLDDIERYARNNPNDIEYRKYSKTFSDLTTNPKIAIKEIKESRLESLETIRKSGGGSLPGIIGRAFVNGLLFNFTFYNMELNTSISNRIVGSSSSEYHFYYFYYAPKKLVWFVFPVVFALGLISPWYIGFRVYRRFKLR